MSPSRPNLIWLLGLLVVLSSCRAFPRAQNQQYARMGKMRKSFNRYFTYMVDNAVLNDMSLADLHFVPHTAEINGVGAARLERMTALLNTYGGTVRYEAREPNEVLVEERIKHVREYLALVGCDLRRVDVAVMRSGGRGGAGDEAVRAFRAASAAEKTSGGGSGVGALSDLAGGRGGR